MNDLNSYTILLILIIFLLTPFQETKEKTALQQSDSIQRFNSYVGDSRTFIMQKNITHGKQGFSGFSITLKVITLNTDNSKVFLSRQDKYSNYSIDLEQGFQLRPEYIVTFLYIEQQCKKAFGNNILSIILITIIQTIL